MTVITISREFGSEGEPIAQQVAQALGYHFVDRTFIGDILNQYGRAEFTKSYETLPTIWERLDGQREEQRAITVKTLNRVIQAVAQHGNAVILGRSGYAVLGGFAGVLHVRVQAPFPNRARRIMAQQEISLEQAEALVKENDKVRMAFVEEFYQAQWNAIQAFDLVVNTSKVSPDLAVSWIVAAANALPAAPAGVPSAASLEVDSILADTIAKAFPCSQAHA